MMWDDLHAASARARERLAEVDKVLAVLEKNQTFEAVQLGPVGKGHFRKLEPDKQTVFKEAPRAFHSPVKQFQRLSEHRRKEVLEQLQELGPGKPVTGPFPKVRHDLPVTPHGDPRQKSFGAREASRKYPWPELKDAGDSFDWYTEPGQGVKGASIAWSGQIWFKNRGWKAELKHETSGTMIRITLLSKRRFTREELEEMKQEAAND